MSAAKTAFSKCAKTFNAQAKALAEKTKDAYSFDRYGAKSWLANIKFLLTKFTEEQVEWIMRSKHARWAADWSQTRPNVVSHNTMKMWYEHGDLALVLNPEMPGATPAVDASRVAKLARIKELRTEMRRLQREVEAGA